MSFETFVSKLINTKNRKVIYCIQGYKIRGRKYESNSGKEMYSVLWRGRQRATPLMRAHNTLESKPGQIEDDLKARAVVYRTRYTGSSPC